MKQMQIKNAIATILYLIALFALYLNSECSFDTIFLIVGIGELVVMQVLYFKKQNLE